jgi:hypothetical protein
VNIFDSEIYGFQDGVAVVPTSAQTTAVLRGNHIHENGVGVINAPGSGANQFTSVVLRHNDIQDNTCGVTVSAFGANASTPTTTDCGAATAATGLNKPTTANIYSTGINLNSSNGLTARGSSATAEIAYSEITNNSGFGIRRLDSSTVRGTSPATNVVSGNASNDGTNATLTLTKRHAKALRR